MCFISQIGDAAPRSTRRLRECCRETSGSVSVGRISSRRTSGGVVGVVAWALPPLFVAPPYPGLPLKPTPWPPVWVSRRRFSRLSQKKLAPRAFHGCHPTKFAPSTKGSNDGQEPAVRPMMTGQPLEVSSEKDAPPAANCPRTLLGRVKRAAAVLLASMLARDKNIVKALGHFVAFTLRFPVLLQGARTQGILAADHLPLSLAAPVHHRQLDSSTKLVPCL